MRGWKHSNMLSPPRRLRLKNHSCYLGAGVTAPNHRIIYRRAGGNQNGAKMGSHLNIKHTAHPFAPHSLPCPSLLNPLPRLRDALKKRTAPPPHALRNRSLCTANPDFFRGLRTFLRNSGLCVGIAVAFFAVKKTAFSMKYLMKYLQNGVTS